MPARRIEELMLIANTFLACVVIAAAPAADNASNWVLVASSVANPHHFQGARAVGTLLRERISVGLQWSGETEYFEVHPRDVDRAIGVIEADCRRHPYPMTVSLPNGHILQFDGKGGERNFSRQVWRRHLATLRRG